MELSTWVLLRDRRHCNERVSRYFGHSARFVAWWSVCVAGCLWKHITQQKPRIGSLLGDTPRWTKRYCREHKASIEGLDHFCTWLNVSVGRQNWSVLSVERGGHGPIRVTCGHLCFHHRLVSTGNNIGRLGRHRRVRLDGLLHFTSLRRVVRLPLGIGTRLSGPTQSK